MDVRAQYWSSRLHVSYRHFATRVTGTVVDAGCGAGHGLATLHAAGARGVIGVDVDLAAIERARADNDSDEVEVVEAELTDLPLVNDTFDMVVSSHAIEHVADDHLMAAELVRIARPGGMIAVCTPNVSTFRPADADRPMHPGHHREYDVDGLRAVLANAGATVTEVQGLRHRDDLAAALHDAHGPAATSMLADRPWPDTLAAAVGTVTPEHFVVDDQLDDALDLIAWARA